MPTDSGKSLHYCLLLMTFDALYQRETGSITIVVSPLMALMKEQVRAICSEIHESQQKANTVSAHYSIRREDCIN